MHFQITKFFLFLLVTPAEDVKINQINDYKEISFVLKWSEQNAKILVIMVIIMYRLP